MPPTLHFHSPPGHPDRNSHTPRTLHLASAFARHSALANRTPSFAGQKQQLTQVEGPSWLSARVRDTAFHTPAEAALQAREALTRSSPPKSPRDIDPSGVVQSFCSLTLPLHAKGTQRSSFLILPSTDSRLNRPSRLGPGGEVVILFLLFPSTLFLCTQMTQAHTAYVLGTNGPCVQAKSCQSCPTFCNPMDCSLAKVLCPWDFPGKNTGLPFPFPGDLPNPGTKPGSLTSPALAGGFFTTRDSQEAPK